MILKKLVDFYSIIEWLKQKGYSDLANELEEFEATNCCCENDWTDGTAYCQQCHKVRIR